MGVHDREMNSFGGMAWRITQRGACNVVVLICALVALQAQTIPRNSVEPRQAAQTLAAGRRTFESTCAPCHGLNGKGGERAPDIATRPEIVGLPNDQLLNVLRDGVLQKGMPSFGALGPAKLSEVLNYVRALQGKGQAPKVMAGAEAGKAIFTGKGGCSKCHMVHGVGGFLGPNLSGYGASHSADDIRGAILSADKRPGFQKARVKTTTKDGRQISGLVRNEDNFSVQLQAEDGTFYLLEKSNLSNLTVDSAPLMPSDYGSTLSKSELDQLLAYLLTIGDTKQ